MLSQKEIQAEIDAANTLADDSYTFTIKGEKFNLKNVTLHQRIWMSKYSVNMIIDEDVISNNPILEGTKFISDNARNAAMVIAIIVKGRHWTFSHRLTRWIGRLIVKFYANKTLYKFDSRMYFKLSEKFVGNSDVADFMNATRLIVGSKITTPKAELVADQQKA